MDLIFPLSSSHDLLQIENVASIYSFGGTIRKPSLKAHHNTIKLEINNVTKVISALGNLIRFPLGVIFRPLLSTL